MTVAIVVAALVLFASLIPPHFLVLSTLLAFLGASMPIVNRGGVLGEFRWVMLLALALGMLLRSSVQGSRSIWHPMHLSLFCFVAYAAISSSYSVNGLMTILKAATFGCLAAAAMLYGRLESPGPSGGSCKLLDQVYWCAVIVALGCALAGIHVLPARAGYFAGPFGNPNGLGAFIPLVGPVLLLQLLRSFDKAPQIRIANVLLTIAYFIFLLMSRSRGGLAAAFLGCGWWLYFAHRRAFGLFLGGSLVTAVIMGLYFPEYVQNLNRVYIYKGSSYILRSRGELLSASWEAAQESPLVGVGFGVSKGYSEDWEFAFESGSAVREKVNSYLALVEEVGLIGAGFVLLPLAWVLVAAIQRLMLFRRLHQTGEEFWVMLTLSACLVGGLASAFFEAWLTSVGFFSTILFWLVFGVLAARLTTPVRVSR
ncbi:MAG: O-antigen ligase family protein [Terriglobia bacterium]